MIQTLLADCFGFDLWQALRGDTPGSPSVQGRKLLSTYTKQVDRLKAQTDALDKLLSHQSASAERRAKYMRDQVVPAMAKLRETGDKIEVLTPHETRPMPTYREMLFVK